MDCIYKRGTSGSRVLVRGTRNSRMTTRHHNAGLRKRCDCPRRTWAKCPHPWHVNFSHRGVHHRLSLDRYLGRRVTSKTEAQTEAARLRLAITDGTFPSTRTDPVVETLETYARDWLRTAELNIKASSVRFYADHLKNHIYPALGRRPIGAITRKDCRDLVATVRDKTLKITTVRGIVRTLSAVLSQAVEDELLSANPALKMGKYLQRGDEPEAEPDPFTREEVEHVVATAREHFPTWHAWVLCGLRTGLRAGELRALKWEDVDWRGRYLLVQRSLVRGVLTTPKNHQRRRVDLSSQLRVVLRLWRRRESARWLALGLPRPDWVFATGTGTSFDESNVRKAFARILTKADLHWRGPHQMRHTFASLLLQAGAPITYVSQQLGHHDSSITLRVYAHWLPEAGAERGVDRLDSQENIAQTLHKLRSGRSDETA